MKRKDLYYIDPTKTSFIFLKKTLTIFAFFIFLVIIKSLELKYFPSLYTVILPTTLPLLKGAVTLSVSIS